MVFDIEGIRKLLEEDKIDWSLHVLARMEQRGIRVREVVEAIFSGEIIEYYSDDYPFPSCLISGDCKNGKKVHVVCSLGNDSIWMITAYIPEDNKWLKDFKTRRR